MKPLVLLLIILCVILGVGGGIAPVEAQCTGAVDNSSPDIVGDGNANTINCVGQSGSSSIDNGGSGPAIDAQGGSDTVGIDSSSVTATIDGDAISLGDGDDVLTVEG